MNIILPRELVEQVRGALENWCNAFPDYSDQEDADAIESLQSALSQPSQVPLTDRDAFKLGYAKGVDDTQRRLKAKQVPLTDREVELVDGMIEVQLSHAERCDHIANRRIAAKQKEWDMERVALLRKLKAAHGIGVTNG